LEEVFEIGDRVTVFRDGRYVATRDLSEVNRPQLIELMTGRDLSKTVKNERDCPGEVVLSVRNLTGANGRFRDISFDLHRGEILGFAGLVGAGRTETMRAVFGIDKLESGEIELYGEKTVIRSPEDSLRKGMALIPEDRKGQGIIGILTNMFNVGLCSFGKLSQKGVLLDGAIRKNAVKYMDMINVKPPEPALNTENMSGGNQQKVVVAKWLSVNAKIIIMDEPTRGIDVGAKEEIYKLMLRLVEEGVSIIMVSSELPEVLSMSNRIMIMHEGQLVGEMNHGEATETNVLHYAMGGE
jgi:ABC-type sugar transport system ATPase subunit